MQEERAIIQSEFKEEKSFARIDIKLTTDSLGTEQIEVLRISEVFGYSFESVFDRQTELQLRNLKIAIKQIMISFNCLNISVLILLKLIYLFVYCRRGRKYHIYEWKSIVFLIGGNSKTKSEGTTFRLFWKGKNIWPLLIESLELWDINNIYAISISTINKIIKEFKNWNN